MKKMNTKYFTIAVYVLAVFAFATVFLLLGLNLRSFLFFIGSILGKISSLFYGIFFALILLPFVKAFDKMYQRLFCRKKPRPILVTTLSLTTTALLILGLAFVSVWFLIPATVDNFTELYNRLAEYFGIHGDTIDTLMPSLKAWLDNIFETNSPIVTDVLNGIKVYLEETFFSIQSASALVSKIVAFLSVLFSEFADIFIGLIISIYLLASRRAISGVCGKLVVAIFPDKFAVKLVVFFKRLYTDFCSFASCRVLTSFLVCAAIFVLSWVGRIPLFSVIVLILFFTQLVPTVGTIIGVLIASAIVLILDPVRAIFFIPALIALEVLISYLVVPLFLPKKLRPSHGGTAVLVLAGYALFGLVGALLAVPVYATLNVEIRSLIAHRLARKQMPIGNEVYEKSPLEDIITEHSPDPAVNAEKGDGGVEETPTAEDETPKDEGPTEE